jgi:hypothetical protein
VKVTHRDQKMSGRMPEGRDLTPFFGHMLAWEMVDEVEEGHEVYYYACHCVVDLKLTI